MTDEECMKIVAPMLKRIEQPESLNDATAAAAEMKMALAAAGGTSVDIVTTATMLVGYVVEAEHFSDEQSDAVTTALCDGFGVDITETPEEGDDEHTQTFKVTPRKGN